MIPELPQAVAADSRIQFDEWWAGVPVAQRKHVTAIATWCMSQNSTMIVESYQAKAKLICAEEMTSTAIVDQAMTLLEFAQVAQKWKIGLQRNTIHSQSRYARGARCPACIL